MHARLGRELDLGLLHLLCVAQPAGNSDSGSELRAKSKPVLLARPIRGIKGQGVASAGPDECVGVRPVWRRDFFPGSLSRCARMGLSCVRADDTKCEADKIHFGITNLTYVAGGRGLRLLRRSVRRASSGRQWFERSLQTDWLAIKPTSRDRFETSPSGFTSRESRSPYLSSVDIRPVGDAASRLRLRKSSYHHIATYPAQDKTVERGDELSF